MVCSYSDSFSQAFLTSRWSEAKHDRQIVQDYIGVPGPCVTVAIVIVLERSYIDRSICQAMQTPEKKMTKRSAKSQKTRTRLLATASKLFRSQGFHATGLDQILRRSRTPKGSFTTISPAAKTSWQSKLYNTLPAKQGQMMSAIFSAQSDPLETLRTFFAHAAENLAASDFRDGCPIAAVTLEVASDRPSVCEACRAGLANLVRGTGSTFKPRGT